MSEQAPASIEFTPQIAAGASWGFFSADGNGAADEDVVSVFVTARF